MTSPRAVSHTMTKPDEEPHAKRGGLDEDEAGPQATAVYPVARCAFSENCRAETDGDCKIIGEEDEGVGLVSLSAVGHCGRIAIEDEGCGWGPHKPDLSTHPRVVDTYPRIWGNDCRPPATRRQDSSRHRVTNNAVPQIRVSMFNRISGLASAPLHILFGPAGREPHSQLD
jgi:hypothetical protein